MNARTPSHADDGDTEDLDAAVTCAGWDDRSECFAAQPGPDPAGVADRHREAMAGHHHRAIGALGTGEHTTLGQREKRSQSGQLVLT